MEIHILLDGPRHGARSASEWAAPFEWATDVACRLKWNLRLGYYGVTLAILSWLAGTVLFFW